MDPITTAIVAALARLSETAIKDAYAALKGVIVRKIGKHNEITKAVEHLENKPDSAGRAQTLAEEIAAAKLSDDRELLVAVSSLVEKLDAQPAGTQAIQQSVTGNQNIFSATGNITIRSS